MTRHPTRRRAFTMVELLIAMALVAMMMLAAALALRAAADSHAYNTQKTDLVIRARGVLDRIARDVRLAQAFTVPDTATLQIEMVDGTTHTYAWDGTAGGNMTYTISDGLTSISAVLTDGVEAFVAMDNSPAASARIALAGDRASAEAGVTAVPRKAVY